MYKRQPVTGIRKEVVAKNASPIIIPEYEVKEERKLDFGKTIISQPDDEVTVVEGWEEKANQSISYILRRANGQKMYLEQDITKIGRESAYVDFYIGDNLQIRCV